MFKKVLFIFFIIFAALLLFTSAKSLYSKKLAKGGTPLSNRSRDNKKTDLNIQKYHPKADKDTKTDGVDISAKSAILIDQETGKIIYQKNPDARLSPASITKILTLQTALEAHDKDDLIGFSPYASEQVANKLGIKAGDKIKMEDLLYGLMMVSANDAAFAIGESIDGNLDTFITRMNEKSSSLGLENTHLTNPSGFDDENHYSSAYDMAVITRYTISTQPEFLKYAGRKEDYSVYKTNHNSDYWWGNISSLLYSYPGMIAVKNGYTDTARSTFVGLAEKNGKRLLVVFLGSETPKEDGRKLLDFGFQRDF